jgi:hypothetical protein
VFAQLRESIAMIYLLCTWLFVSSLVHTDRLYSVYTFVPLIWTEHNFFVNRRCKWEPNCLIRAINLGANVLSDVTQTNPDEWLVPTERANVCTGRDASICRAGEVTVTTSFRGSWPPEGWACYEIPTLFSVAVLKFLLFSLSKACTVLQLSLQLSTAVYRGQACTCCGRYTHIRPCHSLDLTRDTKNTSRI